MNDEQQKAEERVNAASEKEKQATPSPQPHWITIVVGFLSPTIGLVALFVSLQSLKTSQTGVQTSERAMKVGQRAYLTVSNGNFESLEYDLKKGDNNLVSSRVGFTISNLGNTPASIKKMSFVYTLPSGWREVPLENQMEVLEPDNLPGDIGPKQQLIWETSHLAALTLSATAVFRTKQLQIRKQEYLSVFDRNNVGAIDLGEPVRVKASIDYEDVFNEHHNMKWCWIEHVVANDPLPCESLVLHKVPMQ